jgi:alpha,alpha-trehalase
VVFLDYDGTLTPIVATPDLAVLSDEMRNVLRRLADVVPALIVSGRGREDVAGLVQLDNLYFAGSHGFDIAGPDGSEIRYDVGADWVSKMDRVYTEVSAQVQDIEGSLVEHKKFSVAVHFRLVDPEQVPRVEEIVDASIASDPDLLKTFGKKVFDVRPNLDWDKGKAILWLLEALELDEPDVVPFYIGDDVTDEDAFSVVRQRGISVLVSDFPRSTQAEFSLQNPYEAQEFLRRLTSFERAR